MTYRKFGIADLSEQTENIGKFEIYLKDVLEDVKAFINFESLES